MSKRSNIQPSPFPACDRRRERQRKIQQNRGEESRSSDILSMSSTSGQRRQIQCNVRFGDLDVLRGIQVVLSLEITRTQALRQAAPVSVSANVVLRSEGEQVAGSSSQFVTIAWGQQMRWKEDSDVLIGEIKGTESCQRGVPCVSRGQSGSLTATSYLGPCISAVDTHMPRQTPLGIPYVTLQQTLSEDGGPPSPLLLRRPSAPMGDECKPLCVGYHQLLHTSALFTKGRGSLAATAGRPTFLRWCLSVGGKAR